MAIPCLTFELITEPLLPHMLVIIIFLLIFLLVLGIFIHGLCLLMGKRRKVGIAILSCYALVLIHGSIYKQTPHGHIIRFIKGDGYAKQKVDDDAENLRNSPSLEKIHQWAKETILKFRHGELKSAGSESHSGLGSELVPDSEIPQFVRDIWDPEDDPPEVSIGYTYSGCCIVFHWPGHGMVFGDGAFLLELHPPNYQVMVKQGVYTYYYYH